MAQQRQPNTTPPIAAAAIRRAVARGCAIALGLAAATGAGASASPEPGLFGVQVLAPRPGRASYVRAVDQMHGVGASTVFMGIAWSEIERRHGRYDWATTDRDVALYASRGFAIVAGPYGAPAWACRIKPVPADLTACPPGDLRAYRAFVSAAVRRYGAQIADWSEGAESNTVAWLPRPNPGQYARVARTLYSAVKAVDPAAPVYMGGACSCTNGTTGDEPGAGRDYVPMLPFTERVLRALRGRPAFDGIIVQTYSNPDGPNEATSLVAADGSRVQANLRDELLALEQLLADNGYPQAPLQIIMGWGTTADPRANAFLNTAEDQARFVSELYHLVLDDARMSFVQTIYYYASHDFPADTSGFAPFGLFDASFRPKPAAAVYSELAHAAG